MCVQSNPSVDCNNKDLALSVACGDMLTVSFRYSRLHSHSVLMYLSRSSPGLLSVSLSSRTAIATAGIYSCSLMHVVAIGYLVCSPASTNVPWPSLQSRYVADVISFKVGQLINISADHMICSQ